MLNDSPACLNLKIIWPKEIKVVKVRPLQLILSIRSFAWLSVRYNSKIKTRRTYYLYINNSLLQIHIKSLVPLTRHLYEYFYYRETHLSIFSHQYFFHRSPGLISFISSFSLSFNGGWYCIAFLPPTGLIF